MMILQPEAQKPAKQKPAKPPRAQQEASARDDAEEAIARPAGRPSPAQEVLPSPEEPECPAMR